MRTYAAACAGGNGPCAASRTARAGRADPAFWKREGLMSGNSRRKQAFWAFVLRLFIVLSSTAAVAALALFVCAFIVARGPFREASERLCATLAERDPGFAGVFFTTDEIHAATAYLPPREAEGVAAVPYSEKSGAADGGVTKVQISGRGWKGILIRTEEPGAYALSLGAGNLGQSGSVCSAGLDGYIDAVYIDGCLTYAGLGGEDVYCAVACDGDGTLHIGAKTVYDLTRSGYEWAVCADRVLISGGIPAEDLGGGYASRVAVGQTADGRIILVFAVSRGIWPCGITYEELASLMYEYGAVNAAALRPMGGLRVNGAPALGGIAAPDYSLSVVAKGVGGVE